MALDTYTNLKTALASWAGRADLTTAIPDCITMAEAKMNRYLRTRNMVTKDAAFSITGEYVALPTGFGGVRTFYLNTSPPTILEQRADDLMSFSSSNRPRYYNVQGSNFRFGPVPDATYTATLVYRLQVPVLSGSNATNWVLTSHPDAYMFGSMGEICGYLRDFEGAQAWETAMYRVLDEVQKASTKDIASGSLAAKPA